MTSQINYDAIDQSYPIAGQDNDSQGFRDNFGAIYTGLATANEEITALQTNSVLVASLAGNDTVINNLQGSTLRNGLQRDIRGIAISDGVVPAVGGDSVIDVTNGPLQVYTWNSVSTIRFINWPDSTNEYACVRLHFKTSVEAGITIPKANIVSENARSVIFDDGHGSTIPLTFGKQKVYEAWTYNNSTTPIFVRYLGEFTIPT